MQSRKHTDFFRLNTEALFEKSPGLKTALASYAPCPRLSIVDTPAGTPTACLDGILVHSGRDPVREAENLIKREVPDTPGICLFYGFGLGYLVETFIRLFPGVPCLIVEPDVPCFLKALEARDLRAVLNCESAVFFLASEAAHILQFIEAQAVRAVHIVKLRSLHEKNREYYDRTDALIQSFLRQKEVNTNTLRRFGRLWMRNLVRNLGLFSLAAGVNRITDSLSGIPALVCAGGPSLDEILPRLCAWREKLVVIAVDTTLAVLQKNGVDPDFTIVSDPQYWNTRHLDAVKKTDTIVISESSTNPRVFHLLKNKIVFYGSVFPLGRFFESILGEKGKLGAGGSVATTAWDFARSIGCAPIFMAGLDLGFPGKKTHFRGAFFEERFHEHSLRFRPQETGFFSYLCEALPFPAPSNSGGFVLTDHRMAVYKFWFEAQMRLHPSAVTRNLTRLGVKIEGMSCAEFPEIESLRERRNEIDRALAASAARVAPSPALPKALKHRLLEAMVNLAGEMDQTASTAFEGKKTARRLLDDNPRSRNAPALLEKLEKIDVKIRDQSSKNIAGFLAGPLINELLAQQGAPAKDSIENSLRLYEELEKSSRFHAQLLRRALGEFDSLPEQAVFDVSRNK